MKLRAMPIILSLVATLVILFGGWYTYQQFYIEQPIESYIAQNKNVVLKNFEMNNQQVVVDLGFKNPNTFAKDYKDIVEFIKDKTGDKNVIVHLPKQGENMKNLWDEEYFGLAEAIDNKEYSQIPKLVDQMKKDQNLEKTVTRMDDQNIYLYLQHGKDQLYAVLPLQEEVKINE